MYLAEAIESILNQTYTDFEFIIVNDASTDKTLAIIESYKDDRIKLIQNEVNLGLTKSLNKALMVARGRYIARMDADDVAINTRFEMQLKQFRCNNELMLSASTIDEKYSNHLKKVSLLDRSDFLKLELFFGNYIIHSSAMFKKNSSMYNETYKYAQDYELWLRLLKFGEIALTEQVVVQLRTHQNSLSNTNRNEQNFFRNKAIFEHLSQYLTFDNTQSQLHYRLFNDKDRFNQYDLPYIKNWLKKLEVALIQSADFKNSIPVIKYVMKYKWNSIIQRTRFNTFFSKWKYKLMPL